ncbi:hypothetical protein [Bacillus cereus]|uniref:hypothetical protein n=1 Tax=Bacillus cereus TaxID=1396 RepID=UPI00077B1864|nr:hypothetical protein [Bacillus cereus]KXY95193.1 hypothetical protein AT279_21995 [Bacillus cereus]MCD1206006.1 hypothetical protein [Bacillus cereus]MCU5047563.1 hypothetical protein [Bacillus cereus]MCU5651874.1 hypothetical protein [Bacillus cereus]HDR4551278.1 hypothetical protein [Bacillus cereus]
MANNLIEKNWIDDFIKTDAFSEALGMVWRNGYETNVYGYWYFQFTHKSQTIVKRFADFFGKDIKSRYREDKGYVEWYTSMKSSHSFIIKAKELGWTPIQEKSRAFPKGEFNKEVFVKTYILMRHDLGTMREKRKNNKIYVRPRLRIHGSTDILEHLNEFMFEELGIKKKKLQTDGKIPKAKTLYFQSYKDIESILKYIGASETLETLYSFDLGFHDAEEFEELYLRK